MKKQTRRWDSAHKKSLKIYIIIIFLCASLIPLLITSIISYRDSKQKSQYTADNTREQLMNLTGKELDSLIDQIHKVYTQITVNSELNRILAEPAKTELEAVRQRNYINRNILNDFIALNPVINSIIIYPENSDYAVLSGNGGVAFTENYKNFSFYQQAKKTPDVLFWRGLHEYEGSYYDNKQRDIISYYQGLRQNSRFVGVVEIQLKKQYFDNLLSNVRDPYESIVLLLDQDKNLVSSNQVPSQQEMDLVIHQDNADYDTKAFILNNEWSLIYSIPQDNLTQSARQHLSMIILSTLIYFILAVLLALLATWLITKPLNELIVNMEKPIREEETLTESSSKIREIAYLTDSYSEMRRKTRQSIADLIAEQNQKKEAELRVLQAQVNPHFLYNSLNLIRCTAELNGQRDINDMTAALISMLEFSINSQECVSVREEVEIAKQYVTLQSYRQNRKINVNFEVRPQLWDMYILKMSIVPMVENAIIHAYQNIDAPITIQVCVVNQGEKMIISVTDYGAGMTQERIDQVLQEDDTRKKFNRIGLRNIIDRIHLYFGTDYQLSIQSQLGKGSTITVEYPLLTEREWNERKGWKRA